MSKLGIIVTRASAGLQELYSRNREGWEKYSASDIRAMLETDLRRAQGFKCVFRSIENQASYVLCRDRQDTAGMGKIVESEMRNVQLRSVSSMKPSPYTTSVSSPRITFVFAGL